jgi:hypothetical protein
MAATELDTSTFATDVLHSAQPGTLLGVWCEWWQRHQQHNKQHQQQQQACRQ